jgi:hypothetical protein
MRARWIDGNLRFHFTLGARRRREIAKNMGASQRIMQLWEKAEPDPPSVIALPLEAVKNEAL